MKLLYLFLAVSILALVPSTSMAAARSPHTTPIATAQSSATASQSKKAQKRLLRFKKLQSKLGIWPKDYSTQAIIFLVAGFVLIGIGVAISSGTLAFFLYLLGGISLAQAVWHFILFIIDG